MSAPSQVKILTFEQLLAVRKAMRADGMKLVQCHGCFDIVHPGHIRHLRQARALGDCLLVSLTADACISKGAGRPLIPEELRADNLAALDCVDFVYIDQNPTALNLLQDLEPDVYVKGKEYETNTDPRFQVERQTVEKAGGRVVFSSGDIVFSSTALIANLEQTADPYHQRLLQLAKHSELEGDALFSLISSFRDKRMIVIGESIIDTYILCAQPRIASESPIMTLRPIEARHYDGGAAIIARHCAAMGAKPILITPLPDPAQHASTQTFINRMADDGVEVRPIPLGSALPEKQRFLVGQQKMMKIDLVEPYLLDASQQDHVIQAATKAARDLSAANTPCDAAIIADFGLGLFTPKMLASLCRKLRPHVNILAADISGGRAGLRHMKRVDLICPSEHELREAMQLEFEGLPMVASRLLEELNAKHAIVTMGADGLIAFSPKQTTPGPTLASEDPHSPANQPNSETWTSRLSSEHIPALSQSALDPLGCGDSLLAAATLALASKAPITVAAYLGAIAAAVQVQRLGNLPVSAPDLRHMIARIASRRLTYAPNEGTAFSPQPKRTSASPTHPTHESPITETPAHLRLVAS